MEPRPWEAVKEAAMLAALRAKFAQHPALAAVLESTGTGRKHGEE
eukprot:gene30370-23651_t